MQVPDSEEEWLQVAHDFESKWHFPHAIGAMDGKHVVIQAPIDSGTEFYNYKHFFSIVLFALVDAEYCFRYVDVGCQGRPSDGGIFKNTKLYQKLEQKTLKIPPPSILQVPYAVEVPYVILADKAFALNEYTMKPFQGEAQKGSPERIFNYRLSRARRVVENAFGILSSVFRVLRKPMLLHPETATKVVLSTIYMHNYLRKKTQTRALYTPPGSLDSETEGELIPGTWRNESAPTSLLPIPGIPRRAPNYAKEIRSHLAYHFTTNGAIPWQNKY